MRYYWGGIIFAVAAVPLGALLLRTDVRDDLHASWEAVSLKPDMVFASLLAVWVLVSTLWSWTSHRSIHGLLKTIGIIIVAALIAYLLKAIPQARIFRPLLAFTAIGAMLGISTALSNGAAYEALGCCEDGGLQPILSGSAVVCAILVWPCIGYVHKERKRIACALLLAITFVVVAVSHNASAKIMWASGLASVVMSFRVPRLTLVMPAIIAGVGFVTAPFIINIYSAFETSIVYIWRYNPENRAVIWSFFDILFWQRP